MANAAANVRSLEALKRFKANLIDFAEDAANALGEVDADLNRTKMWLEHDRRGYWTNELRRRERKLNEAKSELYRKQMETRDRTPNTALERRAVDRLEQAVREAQQKIERCKHWSRLLDRELTMYKAQVQQLANMVQGDIPTAAAKIDGLIDKLDAYLRLHAPRTAAPPAVAAADAVPSMRQPAADRSSPPDRDDLESEEAADECALGTGQAEERPQGATDPLGPDEAAVERSDEPGH